jgi:probable DNA metabolism protein
VFSQNAVSSDLFASQHYQAKIDFTFESWRNEARRFILNGVKPSEIQWKNATDLSLELFSGLESPQTVRLDAQKMPPRFKVPADFLERAKYIYAFQSDDTPAFLYRVLWRLVNEEPHLLKISIDADTAEFDARYRQVRRDIHKMKAFVRFREIEDRFVAWHKPDHLIVRLAAPFFVERFNGMNWSILTEHECVHWDQKELMFTEGVPRSMAPKHDSAEDLWKTYYSSIFNPARIKWKAMMKEFPVRHWKTMPETEVLTELMRRAPERLQKFYQEQNPGAEKWLPVAKEGESLTLDHLKKALPTCAACGICERATQPVMGVGPLNAQIAFIGEQPGEEEDQAGTPFIGPAGQVLDQALAQVGISRQSLYVTNAVKAYKWTDKEGVGRIHRGSSPQEIAACNPWLKKELEIVKPKKIICLGRSAAQALLGKSVLMREVRGKVFKTEFSDETLVVPHPSFILRIQDKDLQQAEFDQFVRELRAFVAPTMPAA